MNGTERNEPMDVRPALFHMLVGNDAAWTDADTLQSVRATAEALTRLKQDVRGRRVADDGGAGQ